MACTAVSPVELTVAVICARRERNRVSAVVPQRFYLRPCARKGRLKHRIDKYVINSSPKRGRHDYCSMYDQSVRVFFRFLDIYVSCRNFVLPSRRAVPNRRAPRPLRLPLPQLPPRNFDTEHALHKPHQEQQQVIDPPAKRRLVPAGDESTRGTWQQGVRKGDEGEEKDREEGHGHSTATAGAAGTPTTQRSLLAPIALENGGSSLSEVTGAGVAAGIETDGEIRDDKVAAAAAESATGSAVTTASPPAATVAHNGLPAVGGDSDGSSPSAVNESVNLLLGSPSKDGSTDVSPTRKPTAVVAAAAAADIRDGSACGAMSPSASNHDSGAAAKCRITASEVNSAASPQPMEVVATETPPDSARDIPASEVEASKVVDTSQEKVMHDANTILELNGASHDHNPETPPVDLSAQGTETGESALGGDATMTGSRVAGDLTVSWKDDWSNGNDNVELAVLNSGGAAATASTSETAVAAKDGAARGEDVNMSSDESAHTPTGTAMAPSQAAAALAFPPPQNSNTKTEGMAKGQAGLKEKPAERKEKRETAAPTAVASVVEKEAQEHARTRAAAAAAAARAKAAADAEEKRKAVAKEQQAKRECEEACSRLLEGKSRVCSGTHGWSVEQLLALRGGVLELGAALCGRAMPGSRSKSASDAVYVLLRHIDYRVSS